MRKRIFSFVFILQLVLCQASFASFVAVLETFSPKDVLTLSERQFLTDELRAQAGAVLPAYMGYTIMTRENINVMLPPGKSLEECEGSCIAETGRNIAADYVAQGRVGKFGDKLTLTIELYETAGSKLVSSQTSMQTDATELWNYIKANSKDLFKRILETDQLAVKKQPKDIQLSFSSWDKSPFDTIYADSEPRPKKKPSKSANKKHEGFGTFTDNRNNRKYKVIDVNGKIWMAENLDYQTPESDCYEGNPANCMRNGRLYPWYDAVGLNLQCMTQRCATKMDPSKRGVCPVGWHLPSKEEFNSLVEELNRLHKNVRVDFNIQYSGFRFFGGNFMGMGKNARFWTRDESSEAEAFAFFFEDGAPRITTESKNNEYSVRCVLND